VSIFQRAVEGAFAAFLRPYRRMMAGIHDGIAGMSPDRARSFDRLVVAVNTLLFLGIVYCMWNNISRWLQFALAVALYIGYQVFHRALAQRNQG
jgi:hypothetical protein